MTTAPGPPTSADLSHEVAQLILQEATLLEQWRQQDWLNLLSESCHYYLRPTDSMNVRGSVTILFLVADSYRGTVARVAELQRRFDARETVRPHIRRGVSNIAVSYLRAGHYAANADFTVYRTCEGMVEQFVGRYRYLLARDAVGNIRIVHRGVLLDNGPVGPCGPSDFIL